MRKRHDRRQQRQEAAQARQEAWAELSPREQLKALDERLGPGVGARKQRARLQEQLKP